MIKLMITMMIVMVKPDSPTIEEGQVSVQHCQSQYWKFNIEKRKKRGKRGGYRNSYPVNF